MMNQDVDDDNKIYHSAEEDKSNQDHALEDNEEEQMMIHDVGNGDKEENCSKAEESSNYCSKAEVEVEGNKKFVEAGNWGLMLIGFLIWSLQWLLFRFLNIFF